MLDCKIKENIKDNMTTPGTTQLSMLIDPDLKRRIKIMAVTRNLTITDLVVEYVEKGLTKDEKQKE